jgi:hypothetical protein
MVDCCRALEKHIAVVIARALDAPLALRFLPGSVLPVLQTGILLCYPDLRAHENIYLKMRVGRAQQLVQTRPKFFCSKVLQDQLFKTVLVQT